MSDANGFGASLRQFSAQVNARSRAVFVNVASAAHGSIVNGDSRTVAAGQPVDTGALKNSFILEFPSATEALISTNLAYAPGIEDGIGPHGPITLRSAVGGFHSVKQTIANFDRLVESENEKLSGGGE